MNMQNNFSNAIFLTLENAKQASILSIPNDSKTDIQIIFKSKMFNLRKNYLQAYSQYFKSICMLFRDKFQIYENFQEKTLENILQIFNGKDMEMKRQQIYQYYPIIRYLQIIKLQTIIEQDITKNISQYNIFKLIKMAYTQYNQKLFQLSFAQLEAQSYQQLKTQKTELYVLPSTIFKLIIKSHNKFKAKCKTQISFIQVDQILKKYCECNHNSQQKYRQLKYQLFDLTCLTSQQYGCIFLHEYAQHVQKVSPLKRHASFSIKNSQNLIVQYSPYKILSKSSLDNINQQHHLKSSQQVKVSMIITFLTKKNRQLQKENDFLTKQLQTIKSITQKNQQIHQKLNSDLQQLKKKLQTKQKINQNNRKIIDKMQPYLNKLKQQIEKRTVQIQKLLKKQKYNVCKASEEVSSEITRISTNYQESEPARSQFLSAGFLQQMFTGFSLNQKCPIRKKSQEYSATIQVNQQQVMQDIKDEELKEVFSNRIQFNQEPLSIDKDELVKLCQLVADDAFTKKILNLVYRRSKKHPSKGEKMSIRGKQSLLIILRTQHGEIVGGYISKQLPFQDQVRQISDQNAYLFTLSKNKKIPVSIQCQNQAISLSDQFLLGFSSDLIIANNFKEQKSYCSWPKSYGCTSLRNKGPSWLTGGYQFLIEDIQIYQVVKGELEMVI